jgi:hypothetical protein
MLRPCGVNSSSEFHTFFFDEPVLMLRIPPRLMAVHMTYESDNAGAHEG